MSSKAVALSLLGISLFCGVMIVTIGGAFFPEVTKVAAPVLCRDGEFTTESTRYSYKPGQSGVSHRVYCIEDGRGKREITLAAIAVASVIYSVGVLFAFLATIAYAAVKEAAQRQAQRRNTALT